MTYELNPIPRHTWRVAWNCPITIKPNETVFVVADIWDNRAAVFSFFFLLACDFLAGYWLGRSFGVWSKHPTTSNALTLGVAAVVACAALLYCLNDRVQRIVRERIKWRL
jgi:hypothetical protein